MGKLPALAEGPLALAPDAAVLLGGLAAHLGRTAPIMIAPAPLMDAEVALRTVIPAEVVAILAIEGRTAEALEDFTTGIRAYYDAEASPSARDLRFDHVAFAQLVGTPDDWTAEPCFAVFKRTTERDAPAKLVRWDLRKPGVGGERYSLERYVEDRWGMKVAELGVTPIEIIVSPPPLPPAEQVVHRKFGRGRVLSRGDGKLTIAFEDGATRTLAESFVERDA